MKIAFAWRHLKTISKHRWIVFCLMCKCGYPLQGAVHDLSKFSATEFLPSARYFQGNRNKKIEDTVDLIHSGWGSCGSALYCPDCSKSWKERNGNRKMANERNTFIVIMNLFFDAKKAEEGET